MTQLDTILDCLGHEDFNKLVRSVDDVRKRGRFRFWHSSLLERASAETGSQLTEINTFLNVFEDAKPARRTIDIETFLADPVKLWYDTDVLINLEWIRKAWETSPAFVDALSYDLARSVSKTGGFNLASSSVNAISGRLLSAQYVSLYEYVRDESERLESEWRSEFCRLFPESVDYLPPQQELA